MSKLTSKDIGRRLWSQNPYLKVDGVKLSPFNPEHQPRIVQALSKPGSMKRIGFAKYFDFVFGETTEGQRRYMEQYAPRHTRLVFELVEALPLPLRGKILSASTAAPVLLALDHNRAVKMISMQPHNVQKDILSAPNVLNEIKPQAAAELLLVQSPRMRENILSTLRNVVAFEGLSNGFTAIAPSALATEQKRIIKEQLVGFLAARKAATRPLLSILTGSRYEPSV